MSYRVPSQDPELIVPLFDYILTLTGHNIPCSIDYSSMTAFDYPSVNWDSVFQRIANGPRGTMADISREIGINDSMLSRIYRRHLKDPTFNPKDIYWGCSRRCFRKEEEARIATFLIDDLASSGYSMPEKEIKRIAKDHYAITNGRETRRAHFSASNGWIYNFKQRNRLSGRVSQKERKSEPDPTEVQIYKEEVRLAYRDYEESLIFNVDETPIRVAPEKVFTTQRIGKPTPSVHRPGSKKDCVTAIATIGANGQKWPLGIVAKGATPVAVRNLDLRDDIRRYFSQSGKVNEDIAKMHIDQISIWAKGEPCVLIWDSYGAHETKEVRNHAESKRVHLILVPRTATDRFQPLDFGVFGEVSQRHQAMLRDKDVLSKPGLRARRESVAMYASAWDKLGKRTIRKAWMCVK